MALQVEDLNDQSRFRQIEAISYSDLISFVLENIRRNFFPALFFWSACIIFMGLALAIRIDIAGYFPVRTILFHSFLGLIIFPVLIIPVHEIMHVLPFLITGAKRIRAGIDLRQYIFYVTAHRHVTGARQFTMVALTPFVSISLALIILMFSLPGVWKWSLSSLLFVHTTMCVGDFAMVNFLYIHRHRKIYTWDNADERIAYFYEEI